MQMLLRLLIIMFIILIIWAVVRYDPRVDLVQSEGEVKLLLWYNDHSNGVCRTYKVLYKT